MTTQVDRKQQGEGERREPQCVLFRGERKLWLEMSSAEKEAYWADCRGMRIEELRELDAAQRALNASPQHDGATDQGATDVRSEPQPPIDELIGVHWAMNAAEVSMAERLAALSHATAVLHGGGREKEKGSVDILIPFIEDYSADLRARLNDRWDELERSIWKIHRQHEGKADSPLAMVVRMFKLATGTVHDEAHQTLIDLGNNLGAWADNDALFLEALIAWGDWLERRGVHCRVEKAVPRGFILVPSPERPTPKDLAVQSQRCKPSRRGTREARHGVRR